jgi:hypothetical protein
MKWEQDLVRDIRRNDGTDDRDLPDRCFAEPGWPNGNDWKTNSDADQAALKERFLAVKDKCKAILEIGISREGPDSFTNIFIQNKNPDTIYIGIDTDNKTYLDNTDNKVYTIQTSSSNYEQCVQFFKERGVTEFDFIFIDGWHSVNQVLLDWEYTNLLGQNGVVGFHDTQWHPGPKLFVEALDTNKWDVEKQVVPEERDWGIGFARRK